MSKYRDVKPIDIKERMKAAVRGAGYPLYGFCDLFHLSQNVFYMSSNKSWPTLKTIMIVAEKTGVTLEWLVTGKEDTDDTVTDTEAK